MSNRRNARQEKKAAAATADAQGTADSFQNFTAHVGRGTGNQGDVSGYGFNPVTRNRAQIDQVYRGSWIAGRVVDSVAQDMTREGMDITTTDKPSKISEYEKEIARLQIWKQTRDGLKWGRLYGGSILFMMIDGQNPATPMKLDRIRKGQFKGLMPIDRWLLTPSLNDLVDDLGVNFGKPRFYETVPDMGGMPKMKIHFSRVIRVEGVELPYWQKIAENLWGQSVLERMWDRLIAYDSATAGVSQMMYKAHLRVLKVEGLREIIGGSAAAMRGLLANINMIRTMQSNEGLTLLDKRDDFEAHQYGFGGVDQILAQFGEQLAGAVEIPLVRLFGQSPAGFSTGDHDIRTYYDSIKQQQVAILGDGMETVYRLVYISKFGTEPPKEFSLDFKPLWQMSDTEKSQITNTTTAAIGEAFSAQMIPRSVAMKELKALSKVTGTFSNISDQDISRAESDPDPSPEALGLEIPKPVAPKQLGQNKPKALPPPKPARGQKLGAAKGPNKGDADFFDAFDDFDWDLTEDASHFDPGEKRDANGKWTAGNAVSKKAGRWTLEGNTLNRTKSGGWTGGTAAEHARASKLTIPPHLTDVRVNPDPKHHKLAVGRDSKGRSQTVYRPVARELADVEKFERQKAFQKVAGKVATQAANDMLNTKLPATTRDSAAALYLISQTGIRPGSDKDTAADIKAYGATQLEGRHVAVHHDNVKLSFVGKAGVHQRHEFKNAKLAAFFRTKNLQGRNRLFDINDNNLRGYLKDVAGDDFVVKDFRTYTANAVALRTIKEMPTPDTGASYRAAVKQVAALVSEKLGNTPAQALKSYIDPMVFNAWLKARSGAKVRDALNVMWTWLFGDAEEPWHPDADLMESFYETNHYDTTGVNVGDWHELAKDDDEDAADLPIDDLIDKLRGVNADESKPDVQIPPVPDVRDE